MRIEAGVQFLFAKALIYNVFRTKINETRLWGSEKHAFRAGSCFIRSYLLTTGRWYVHLFIIPEDRFMKSTYSA